MHCGWHVTGKRLLSVVVYIAPSKEFADVNSESDVDRILTRCAPEMRKRLEHEATTDQEADIASEQAHLI